MKVPPPPIDLRALHDAQRRAVIDFAREPRTHSGKGIVTTLYDREFPSGWVLLSELKRLNVPLPVEAFHKEGELSPRHRALAESLGVDLTIRILEDPVLHWAIKPFSIWRSRFREVMWLDADSFPIRDPSFLFDDPEYKEKGSMFWRDVGGTDRALTWHPLSDVWRVFNVPINDAEEFETGQILLDKERRWAELGLTLHFNLRSDIYYRFVWGDKDTFRLAWQNLAAARKKPLIGGGEYLSDPAKVPYGFMPYGPFHMGAPNQYHKWGGGTVMVQRDRQGAPIFNHRALAKLRVDADNIFNADVPNEAIYHEHIARLRELLARG